MNLTTLTEEEARELLNTVRALNDRSEKSFKDFKMDEIPKSKKANLPLVLGQLDSHQLERIDSILDWWDNFIEEQTAKGRRSRYVVPLVVTAISPILGGVIVAVIIKVFAL